MKVLFISEENTLEKDLIELLRAEIACVSFDIVALDRQLCFINPGAYEMIFIPFLPAATTPFGKWVTFVIEHGGFIICVNSVQSGKYCEFYYRKSQIVTFANLGVYFLSWSKGQDIFLKSLVPAAQILHYNNYIAEVKTDKTVEEVSIKNVAIVLDFREYFWPEKIVSYKLNSGYKLGIFEKVRKIQKKYLDRLAEVIKHLSAESSNNKITVFCTSTILCRYLENKIDITNSPIQMSTISERHFRDTINKSTMIAMSEPILGLEDDIRAFKLFNYTDGSELLVNSQFSTLPFLDLMNTEGALLSEKSAIDVKNYEQRQFFNYSSLLGIQKSQQQQPSKRINTIQLLFLGRIFFWRLLCYNVTNQILLVFEMIRMKTRKLRYRR